MFLIPVLLSATNGGSPPQFEPTVQSLRKYACPEWFRDAKFGIWAHWGPQSVPMMGDWYARNMYIQGSTQYEDHLKRWGHPSEHGYREIIDLWKAEKWDPAELMKLYKQAGAKYFVSMACHHDNFDLWNSKYHRWNAVELGPHRDVVGEWQKAAKANGLRFGVSEHMGASYTWFQTSHGSDKTGPKAGVPYDGTDLRYVDLYHPAADADDTGWYSTNEAWHQEWKKRITDLLTSYKPDLLYSDGTLPFGQTGRDVVSAFYNDSVADHNGSLQAVYTFKGGGTDEFAEGSGIDDLERGVMPRIADQPWQTDTSIGDWFYNKNWKFRGPEWVITTLVDVVSKNGNLLLNVVQRPDGTIDPEVHQLLKDVGDWMDVHGEAIYGTRPWVTFGEGAVRAKGGSFKEDFDFTSRDVRYTRKGSNTLYATLLGIPSSPKLDLHALALTGQSHGMVHRVSLLGSSGSVDFTQDSSGLHLTLPADFAQQKYALTVKIECDDVMKFDAANVQPTQIAIKPSDDGDITLKADSADLQGSKIQEEDKGGIANVGYWDNASDSAVWSVETPVAHTYRVLIDASTIFDGAELRISCGNRHVDVKLPNTHDWGAYRQIEVGGLLLPAGKSKVVVGAVDPKKWKAVNVRGLYLMQ